MNNKPVTRCTKCVLPSSLPGSEFNEAGECFWCRTGFPGYKPMGEDKLRDILDMHRNRKGSIDCLVGISGGKDSSYVLLQMMRKFDMRVEGFTYVHDGLTDFALRNAIEVCKTLGVPHHQLSLARHAHLESFRAFFKAWVTSGQAVAAAMTCVGCKHLHILGTRLARDRGIPMIVWAMCPLEIPPFIPTQTPGSGKNKSQGMLGLGTILLTNMWRDRGFRNAFFRDPSTCVYGCLAFKPGTGYLQMRYPSVKHVHYFDYCDWNRDEIVATLKANTPWSVPDYLVTDWHSDCVFNVFKEYMYQKIFGASYTDAFLSNQIRHGLMTREQAWNELLRSKEYYARELPVALSIVGLEHLGSQCDPSCFDIT